MNLPMFLVLFAENLTMTTCTSCRRFRVGDEVVSPEVLDAVGPLTVVFIDCRHGNAVPRRDLGVTFTDRKGYSRTAGVDITAAVHNANAPDADGG